ncbi:GntP family permease [Sinomicrobium weinanense]|uniref:Gluconate transporter n=1 Tax=Sinomicrobium weinanense TaxID=2842200 RepID=A0A926JT50_9FLAO|nr:gluconate:H+ symporter [Sinomicrobium weinanense]MBC9796891.1 gluconate transporter [Sinomicrobium weinanense]MBU3124199.1 GntP family permease [Sinomicrobium weinanense]
MIEYRLLAAIALGIFVLLFLILKVKLHAFLSLLIAAITVGIAAGLDAAAIMQTVQNGMGSTLGFVATVVGLGAMFGAILEHSGGARRIAGFLMKKFGVEKAPVAMVLSGFIVAIPVFFDVAFILLIPLIYALQKRTGKSLLLFAIPLLSGLAVTHAFIPPTPGPIAVADIIGADLGWVIGIGFVVGIPTAIISGLLFGKYIGKRIFVPAPPQPETTQAEDDGFPGVGTVFAIIAVPICLILINTSVKGGLIPVGAHWIRQTVSIVGHPFAALIIANLLAWYFLGIGKGFTRKQLLDISAKSMTPAGSIILITGAGGAFKQVLIETGSGDMIAQSLAGIGFPVLLFAFLISAAVRIIQGSSTVAMITAAGLVAPLLEGTALSGFELACIVIAIASGGSIMSHVNDSGFWMVNQFLGLTEKQTFRSWTVMTTILAFTGFITVSLLYYLF